MTGEEPVWWQRVSDTSQRVKLKDPKLAEQDDKLAELASQQASDHACHGSQLKVLRDGLGSLQDQVDQMEERVMKQARMGARVQRQMLHDRGIVTGYEELDTGCDDDGDDTEDYDEAYQKVDRTAAAFAAAFHTRHRRLDRKQHRARRQLNVLLWVSMLVLVVATAGSAVYCYGLPGGTTLDEVRGAAVDKWLWACAAVAVVRQYTAALIRGASLPWRLMPSLFD